MAINQEDGVLRWQQNLASDATKQKYIKKTANPKRNPMEAAATDEANARLLASVRRSIESGRRSEKLRNTPLSKYINGCAKKGAERLQSGAASGVDAYRKAAAKWYPVMDQMSQEVAGMPKGGLANAKARSARALEIVMNAAGTA